jgi:hypothetical protein
VFNITVPHTGPLQQLDISINKTFKAFMSENSTKWLEVPNPNSTPSGQMTNDIASW